MSSWENLFTTECLPSKIYLLFSLFSIIASLSFKFTIIRLLSSIIASLLWFYLLMLLCNNKMEFISWFLLFPLIIVILIMLFFQYLAYTFKKNIKKSIKKGFKNKAIKRRSSFSLSKRR